MKPDTNMTDDQSSSVATFELCEDCTVPVSCGDYTGLDYWYDEEMANRRMREIDEGYEVFCKEHGGYLMPVFDKPIELGCNPCDCCKARSVGKRSRFRLCVWEIDNEAL